MLEERRSKDKQKNLEKGQQDCGQRGFSKKILKCLDFGGVRFSRDRPSVAIQGQGLPGGWPEEGVEQAYKGFGLKKMSQNDQKSLEPARKLTSRKKNPFYENLT